MGICISQELELVGKGTPKDRLQLNRYFYNFPSMTSKAKVVNLYSGVLHHSFCQAPQMRTAYLKTRMESVDVGWEGFPGDEHTKGHGGKERAVNHFPQEDYEVLKSHFPSATDTLCATELNGFGENISTIGGNMNFKTVCIGDQFRIGTCILEVAHPRYPCKKLNFRHNETELTNFSLKEGISGWFYRVLQPGTISIDDEVERIAHPHPEWTLHRLQTGLFGNQEVSKEFLEGVINLKKLTDMRPWKIVAQTKLEKGQYAANHAK